MPDNQNDADLHIPTAVVAGGAGFIGASLCEKLLDSNIEVVCLDTLSQAKENNLRLLRKHPNFHFLQLSLQKDPIKRITRAHYIFYLIEDEPKTSSSQSLDSLITYTKLTKQLVNVALKHQSKFLLASVIFSAAKHLSTTSLEQNLGPTHQEDNFYSFTETQRIVESITAESYKHSGLNARVVRLIDVYGPGMDLQSETTLAQFIYSLIRHQPLQIYQGGLNEIYPTYVYDVIAGLVNSMFTIGTSGKIITLANPDKITAINLAYQLRQLSSSNLEITSTSTKPQDRKVDPLWFSAQHDIKWKPKVELLDGLGQTIQWARSSLSPENTAKPLDSFSQPQQEEPSHTQTKKEVKEEKNLEHESKKLESLHNPNQSKTSLSSQQLGNQLSPKKLRHPVRRGVAIAFILLILSILIPTSILGASVFIAFSNLNQTKNHFESGDISSAKQSAQVSSSFFNTSQQTLKTISRVVSPLGLDSYISRLEKIIGIGSSLAQASVHLSSASQSILTASFAIIGQQSDDPLPQINSAQADITKAYELIALTSVDLKDERPNLSKLASFSKQYALLQEVVPQMLTTTDSARSLLAIVPEIIGSGGFKKTYLVLLQNNAELRPTGGFIGSFALITFQNNKLLDFIVNDVYTADGQLVGHVEPPPALKRELGEANWFLRDSNWDPDFPTSARQAEWFLEKEIGKTVDGTIAVNLFVAQNLLDAFGEVDIPDYSETITSTNLFERAEFHSEVDFFPGSTQKKDFLSNLTQRLYLRAQTATEQEILSLSQGLLRSFNERQLQISLANPLISEKLTDLGWDGSINSGKQCQSQSQCFSDYLSLIDTNIGINKANFFVERVIDHQIQIFKEDNTSATTKVTYTNSSPAESWPAGSYKNYLRLYTPEGSTLRSVTVGDSQLESDQIDILQQHNKTIFGFRINVPIKSQLEVEINYKLPGELEFEPGNPVSTYKLLVQKQSGTDQDPLNLTIIHPAYMKPLSIEPEIDIQPQNLIFASNLTSDRNFSIDFTK